MMRCTSGILKFSMSVLVKHKFIDYNREMLVCELVSNGIKQI